MIKLWVKWYPLYPDPLPPPIILKQITGLSKIILSVNTLGHISKDWFFFLYSNISQHYYLVRFLKRIPRPYIWIRIWGWGFGICKHFRNSNSATQQACMAWTIWRSRFSLKPLPYIMWASLQFSFSVYFSLCWFLIVQFWGLSRDSREGRHPQPFWK